MNEGKRETDIQGDVYGLVQGDQAQVTMHFHHPPLSRREGRDRKHFLANVRAYRIEEKLKQSLQGTAQIALRLKYHSDILASSQRPVLQTEDMSITQAFDKAAGKLLILGEEGAGKTTLLLELTRELLERAEKDKDHPMPVVLNLSSWAMKGQALTEWLIEELQKEEYEVPTEVAEGWVKGDQLALLLDGLDEMSEEARGRCIGAINSYRRKHGLVLLVVCSREADYLSQAQRQKRGKPGKRRSADSRNQTQQLSLRRAVVVQPLTPEQIDECLARSGEQVAAVRVALRDHLVLPEESRTPLMLNILALAYRDATLEEILADASTEAWKLEPFLATYVQKVLSYRGEPKAGTAEQIVQWLSWLASQMIQHHLSEFYLERLQSDWLGDRRIRARYRRSLVLVFGLVFGVVAGLVVGLYSGLLYGLASGLFAGLLLGLVAGLSFGLPFGQDSEIHPTEVIKWTWGTNPRVLFFGLLGGVVFGLPTSLFFGPLFGLFFGLASFLGAGLVVGSAVHQVDEHTHFSPNQGIWRSARSGLVVSLVSGLFFVLLNARIFGLAGGVIIGLFLGLLFGLGGGLSAFLKHFILRFWLWRGGYLPWDLVAFLDEAAERLLVDKVGGGYIFRPSLLDYFALMDTTTPDQDEEA